MYVKYLAVATLQAVCQLEKMCFLYWHCRVLKFIVSITKVTMNLQQIDTIKTWLTFKTFQKVQIF
jgi:hypothetical protein